MDYPCHSKPKEQWCDRHGHGGFMGHTCIAPQSPTRYITRHDLPTPHERELLQILAEEAAEIVVAVSKLQRFGRDDGYPGTDRTNSNDLGLEIGDLMELVDRVIEAGLTTRAAIAAGKVRKAAKLPLYLQTEPA